MNDAQDVRLGNPYGGLEHEINRLLDRKWPALPEPPGQVSAFEKLHHHVGSPVRQLPYIQHPGDMLVLDLDRGPGFAQKSLDGGRLGQHFASEKLDGDLFLQVQVLGGEDDAHSPGTEQSLNAVLSGDDLARPNV